MKYPKLVSVGGLKTKYKIYFQTGVTFLLSKAEDLGIIFHFKVSSINWNLTVGLS